VELHSQIVENLAAATFFLSLDLAQAVVAYTIPVGQAVFEIPKQ